MNKNESITSYQLTEPLSKKKEDNTVLFAKIKKATFYLFTVTATHIR